MLFSVKAGNNSLHGMFQAFKLGGNYVILFVIFSLFWDTVFWLRKLILITLKLVGTHSSEISLSVLLNNTVSC